MLGLNCPFLLNIKGYCIKKPSQIKCEGILCPGSDLNRYDRCGSQDFKSCVSTNSTTRATFL